MYLEATASPFKRLRGVVKTGCAMGMYWSSLDRLIGSRNGLGQAPLVIGYHRVVEDIQLSKRNSISPQLTSTHMFEKQLDWIGRNYELVSLDDLVTALERRGKHNKPVAAITFDDGYSDVYSNALPILKRKGIPAAVFVVTNLVGTRQLLVHDELYLLMGLIMAPGKGSLQECIESLSFPPEQLNKLLQIGLVASDPFQATRAILEMLSQIEINLLIKMLHNKVTISKDVLQEFQLLEWDQLKEMIAQGITVGSHSKSHALLTHNTPAEVEEELQGSRSILERRLGIQIKHFAYPDGLFDSNAIKAAAAAGYRSAYTTCSHRDHEHPLLTIPRKMLWEHSSMDMFGNFSAAILRCQINGIFDPANKCQLQHWA